MGLTGDMHLTPEQLAERWHMLDKEGVPQTNTLRGYRTKGGGPKYIKLGRRILYPLAEVETWEKAHMMAATTVKLDATHVRPGENL